ncbi:MAG TPA: ParB/RepB/Spo0J family partition protein [bacterium]|nr:ParB/RepB/Spo0J family partition protein [bacterium]HPJ71483.1 ParB/RepB/Spo0J family partition protein [bacterium]HPQ66387.1 ParB/RepB/Spo0J family partition protein [bacterium]
MRLMTVRPEEVRDPVPLLRFQTREEEVDRLAESIRELGLLSPPVVKPAPEGWDLVSGSRRLAAVKKLGWKSVPVLAVEKTVAVPVAVLAENLVRVDISPLERARALATAIGEGLEPEELAKRVGRTPGYIRAQLRLLEGIHPRVLELLENESITYGHAEALMRLSDRSLQLKLADRIAAEGLNVKETELEVDLARPQAELTEREAELNRVERTVIGKLPGEWRNRFTIRQGRSSEKLVVNFRDRNELRGLLKKIAEAL